MPSTSPSRKGLTTERTTQKTQGLYWFGPPLWCNTLLQCGGWIASWADEEESVQVNGLARACSWLGDELLGRVQSPFSFSLSTCSRYSNQMPLPWGCLVLFIG